MMRALRICNRIALFCLYDDLMQRQSRRYSAASGPCQRACKASRGKCAGERTRHSLSCSFSEVHLEFNRPVYGQVFAPEDYGLWQKSNLCSAVCKNKLSQSSWVFVPYNCILHVCIHNTDHFTSCMCLNQFVALSAQRSFAKDVLPMHTSEPNIFGSGSASFSWTEYVWPTLLAVRQTFLNRVHSVQDRAHIPKRIYVSLLLIYIYIYIYIYIKK